MIRMLLRLWQANIFDRREANASLGLRLLDQQTASKKTQQVFAFAALALYSTLFAAAAPTLKTLDSQLTAEIDWQSLPIPSMLCVVFTRAMRLPPSSLSHFALWRVKRFKEKGKCSFAPLELCESNLQLRLLASHRVSQCALEDTSRPCTFGR